MSPIDKTAPELCQFLGGYINQDFNYEFGSLENAVNAYFESAPVDCLRRLLTEIDVILELPLSESEFDKLLEQAGSEYYTYADKLTGRQWVKTLREVANEKIRS